MKKKKKMLERSQMKELKELMSYQFFSKKKSIFQNGTQKSLLSLN